MYPNKFACVFVSVLGLSIITGLVGCRDDNGDQPPQYDGAVVDGPPSTHDSGPRVDGPQQGDGKVPIDSKVVTPTGVMVTEYMPNPDAVSDSNGEWFELYNPTNSSIDLSGWTIKDDGSDTHTIGKLSIGAKAYAVLAKNSNSSTNGGVKVDYAYSGINLANSTDEIVLLDGSGKQVDRVTWTSSYQGTSSALKALHLDNGQASAWCPSGSSWQGSKGDKGSPGQPNSCGSVTKPDAGVPTDSGLPYLKHSISFNSSLCGGIKSGSKKITLRNNHWTWIVKGEWVYLKCGGVKYKAQLTEVRLTTWGGITKQEYTDDGFSSQSNMMAVMKTYYPGITLSSKATVIRWAKAIP